MQHRAIRKARKNEKETSLEYGVSKFLVSTQAGPNSPSGKLIYSLLSPSFVACTSSHSSESSSSRPAPLVVWCMWVWSLSFGASWWSSQNPLWKRFLWRGLWVFCTGFLRLQGLYNEWVKCHFYRRNEGEVELVRRILWGKKQVCEVVMNFMTLGWVLCDQGRWAKCESQCILNVWHGHGDG